jgi:hypothetical protein
MSKPAGRCVFCDNPRDLTKSHIWPEWIENILPQTATHHEQSIGSFDTFVPTAQRLAFHQRVRQGHVATRKPRNTCKKCNGGWMRHIEEAAISIMPPLLLSRQDLLNTLDQRLLASFLCLICMRVELSSRTRSIPPTDHHWLMDHFEPPANWKIWIARYAGGPLIDERYTALQIASSKNVTAGVEYCNSQVTTLVIGQLCAHLYSSTAWPDFPGYEGIELAPIWPQRCLDIEVSMLPTITEADVPWLHEAITRDLVHVPGK